MASKTNKIAEKRCIQKAAVESMADIPMGPDIYLRDCTLESSKFTNKSIQNASLKMEAKEFSVSLLDYEIKKNYIILIQLNNVPQ